MLPYRTADDHIAGVVLTLLDVTARRQTETALRTSDERLRLVVENARDYAIFSLDLDRRVTTWNTGAERLLGYRESEVLGLSADLIFTPEDIAAGVPAREAATALATGRAGDDRFHQRKDGTRFWASGSMMPMHDGADEVVGLVKILRDQTEARRAHEALERSRAELLQAWRDTEAARRESELQKEHLSALFTQAPAPICILRGADYRVEFANAPHVRRVEDERRRRSIDKPVFEAVPALQRTALRGMLDDLMRSGTPQVGKEVPAVLDRDGSGALEKVYLNFSYAPLRGIDGGIDGVLAIAFDVSDEIRAREQMSALHDEARTASRAKDDFLAMLGHELRNPLAPLRNSLQLMRLHAPAAARRPVARCGRKAGRQPHPHRRRPARGGAHHPGQDRAAHRPARPCGRRPAGVRHRPATSSPRTATASSSSCRTKPLFVDADPMRMEQIVVNLLNNAAKYTPAGGRIRIELRAVDAMAELRVIDNGIGIPADLRPRLFQLFQQGPRQLSPQGRRAGRGPERGAPPRRAAWRLCRSHQRGARQGQHLHRPAAAGRRRGTTVRASAAHRPLQRTPTRRRRPGRCASWSSTTTSTPARRC